MKLGCNIYAFSAFKKIERKWFVLPCGSGQYLTQYLKLWAARDS